MFVHPMPYVVRCGGYHCIDDIPKGALEVSHHLPDRNARAAVVRTVVLREVRLHCKPVNLLGQKDQLVVHVYETFQCYFEDGHLMFLRFFAYHVLNYLQVSDPKISISCK